MRNDKKVHEDVLEHRDFNYPIHPLMANRWSPRAMNGEELSDEDLLPLFEAARWAPSSFNGQPWRFIYAKRNTPEWDHLFSLMVEFNQSWTKNAALIAVVISKKTYDQNGKEAATHSYDTGSAWMSLALEGEARDLVVHGMSGFDYEKARTLLEIPDDYAVEAMFAVGKKAPKESLPLELQKKEVISTRRPLREILMKGKFLK